MSNGRIQKIVSREEMDEEIVRICPDEYKNMVQYHRENSLRVLKGEPVLTWEQEGYETFGGFSFQVLRGRMSGSAGGGKPAVSEDFPDAHRKTAG